jgi:hypothetical protein
VDLRFTAAPRRSVDSLVKNTGGRLEIKSDERGVIFSIQLPPKWRRSNDEHCGKPRPVRASGVRETTEFRD